MFLAIAILAIYTAVYITSPLITVFHELGHAFAYLVLTKPDNIDVFIGSYGNTETWLKFKIGRIHFYIKPSYPFIRGKGMCRSNKDEGNYISKIIILLAGPLFTVLMAFLIGFIALNTNVHGSVKLYCFALIICSVISLYVNLRPRKIKSVNLDNDGKQLLFTITNRKVFSAYVAANEKLGSGEYQTSADMFLKINNLCPGQESFLRPLITSLLLVKNLKQAEEYLIQLAKITEFDIEDHLNLGYIQSVTNRHEAAIKNYREVLAIDGNNLYMLNNLGYELVLKGEYEKGEELLERAIILNPQFAAPYCALGYLKLQTGSLDDGRLLVEKSIALDPNYAYAYKHLGQYYLRVFNKEEALKNFNKAIALDTTIDLAAFMLEVELL